jgi:hypothetical protein
VAGRARTARHRMIPRWPDAGRRPAGDGGAYAGRLVMPPAMSSER